MAGRGSRFAKEGFKLPKPLIDVRGVPMIQLAMSNLRPNRPHRFVFLCLQDHLEQYPTEQILRSIDPNCEIVPVEGVTQGAACTVLLAKGLIDSDDSLMVVNSDQWVDLDVNAYLDALSESNADGLIMTMSADDPKWSFVRMNKEGAILEVAEKQVISNEATVGIYNFQHGRDFVAAAEEMIVRDLRVNNEFYLAPAYNIMIEQGKKIVPFNIGTVGNGMHGLGTPEDLKKFLKNDACEKALAAVTKPSRTAAA
ncbi:glycosyltransferase family 2 protein [Bremerella sp. JC817]|uniref:glycosyltransferase family 2 protein n=1 Tax=Bremerella sp. JC817 TaxID=3231756 RepID=UPI003459A933